MNCDIKIKVTYGHFVVFVSTVKRKRKISWFCGETTRLGNKIIIPLILNDSKINILKYLYYFLESLQTNQNILLPKTVNLLLN